MSKTPLTVPPHMRLRPDHVGVYDEVVLASDYAKLETDRAELVEIVKWFLTIMGAAGWEGDAATIKARALLARPEADK